MHNTYSSPQSGFSLIELSVIITLAATLAVGFLVWTSPPGLTNAEKNIETHHTLQEISSAIEAFRVREGRLPCPADPFMREDNTRLPGAITDSYVNPFGIEDLNTNRTGSGGTSVGIDCPNPVGTVPVHSLGLSSRYAFDAWNRQLLYHVSDALCGTSTVTTTTGNVIHKQKSCNDTDYLNNSGNITVQQENGENLAKTAAYIVVSYGENGYGGRLSSAASVGDSPHHAEIENYNGDTLYVLANTSSNFDDLLLYRTKSQIEQLTNKKDALLFSKTTCRENGTAIESLNTTTLQHLQTTFTTYQQNDQNTGDQVALGILLSIQEICIEYYGADNAGIAAWGGPACPGDGHYFVNSRACECPSGNWDNCCPGGNWDACLDL